MYAATASGLLKTDDAGLNWRSVAGRISSNGIFLPSVVIDPQNPGTLYLVASSNSGRVQVLRSADGGETWSAENYTLPSGILALAIDPQNSDTLYAGTNGSGIFKSTDGGTNWRVALNTGLMATHITALVIEPQAPGTLYAGVEGSGIFKSMDGGAGWVRSMPGLDVAAVVIDPHDTGTVYAATSESVFKSEDGGTNWRAVNSGLPAGVGSLAIDPQNPRTVYAGAFSGVFKSTDGGASWSAASSGLLGFVFQVAIDPQNTSTIYAATYACAGSCNSGVFKSADGGLTWRAPDYRLGADGCCSTVTALAIAPSEPSTLYAGTGDMNGTGGSIWKSTNGGFGWLRLRWSIFDDVCALAVDPQNSGTVYASGCGSMFRSTDGGASWSAADAGLTAPVSVLAIDPQDTNKVYAGTFGGGVFAITFAPETPKPESTGKLRRLR
jgi:photosystem II stability/assembly factor-like uncharacterized protein